MSKLRASRLGRLSWTMFDWANQPFYTLIMTFVFAVYFTDVFITGADGAQKFTLTQTISGIAIAILNRLRHGLRFDARVRGRSMPSSFSANYSLLYDFSDTWQGRLAFLNTRSFGDEASNDVKLQVRSQLSYRASPRLNFNIEYYSQLGSVDNVSPWNSQQHQIGPSVSWRTNTDWVLYGGILSTLNNR